MTLSKQEELKAAQETIMNIENEALVNMLESLEAVEALLPAIQEQLPLLTGEAKQYTMNMISTLTHSSQSLRNIHQNNLIRAESPMTIHPPIPNPVLMPPMVP